MKEIPFLSVNEINSVEDYERFYHVKAYLKQKSGALTYFKDEVDDLKELAGQSGYKKFNKFIEHRKEWHEFTRRIPLSYLEAIDVKLDVLQFTVELDKKDFEKALKLRLHPEYFMINYSPIPLSKSFPPDTSEEEAVNILREYCREKEKLCLINYPALKTIGVRPDGSVFTIYYEPEIKLTKDHVIPVKSGKSIGKTYLI